MNLNTIAKYFRDHAIIIGFLIMYVFFSIFIKNYFVFSDFLLNLFTELIGISITVLIIDRLIQIREEERKEPFKSNLLREIVRHYCNICLMTHILFILMNMPLRLLLFDILHSCKESIEEHFSMIEELQKNSIDVLSYDTRNTIYVCNNMIELAISTLSKYKEGIKLEKKEYLTDGATIYVVNHIIINMLYEIPITAEFEETLNKFLLSEEQFNDFLQIVAKAKENGEI